MKIITKSVFIIIFAALAFGMSGCYTENPTYYEGGNAFIWTELFNVQPGSWNADPTDNFRWYFEYPIASNIYSNWDLATVLVYYRNENDAWEALPSSRLFWTEDGVVYSDELWYSYTNDYIIAIDYRNTHPTNAQPPTGPMSFKAVIIDGESYSYHLEQGIDFNDYEDVRAAFGLN
jgi:hypothetical protein